MELDDQQKNIMFNNAFQLPQYYRDMLIRENYTLESQTEMWEHLRQLTIKDNSLPFIHEPEQDNTQEQNQSQAQEQDNVNINNGKEQEKSAKTANADNNLDADMSDEEKNMEAMRDENSAGIKDIDGIQTPPAENDYKPKHRHKWTSRSQSATYHI